MDKITRVLVIGGTGMLGRPVTRRLVEEGYTGTVGSRSPGQVEDIFGSSVKAATVDFSSPASLAAALEGQDAVHLNLPSGPRFEDCLRNEARAAETVANAAAQVKLKRISYLSGETVGPDRKFPPVQAKWQAEEAIRASGVPFTIWRATWFMETLTNLVKGGLIVILGSGRSRVHWLAGEDLGTSLAKALRTEDSADRIFYIYGPEAMTFKEAVLIFRDTCHPEKKIMKIPTGLAIILGKLTGGREMWFGAQMIRYLDAAGETGDPIEMSRLLGPTKTTLAQFAAKLKG